MEIWTVNVPLWGASRRACGEPTRPRYEGGSAALYSPTISVEASDMREAL